jgi:hypothetical protein
MILSWATWIGTTQKNLVLDFLAPQAYNILLKSRKSKMSKKLNIKLGNKQNVVVGGEALGQRFPVTLYAPSWLVLLDDENVQAIREFIEANRDKLSWGRE